MIKFFVAGPVPVSPSKPSGTAPGPTFRRGSGRRRGNAHETLRPLQPGTGQSPLPTLECKTRGEGCAAVVAGGASQVEWLCVAGGEFFRCRSSFFRRPAMFFHAYGRFPSPVGRFSGTCDGTLPDLRRNIMPSHRTFGHWQGQGVPSVSSQKRGSPGRLTANSSLLRALRPVTVVKHTPSCPDPVP